MRRVWRRGGACYDALVHFRRTLHIEPLHPRHGSEVVQPSTLSDRRKLASQKRERLPYDAFGPSLHHGLTGDARQALAEADAEYEAAQADIDQAWRPRSQRAVENSHDTEDAGEAAIAAPGHRIAAPFMERLVASYEEGYAHRGAGELRPRESQWTLNRLGEVSRRMENQLAELVESSLPHEEKQDLVLQLLSDAMAAGVPLQASAFEDVSSLLMATPYNGNTPFPHTQTMLQMYRYMKSIFTAPTAAIVEHLMVTLARLPGESEQVLHQATRLLIDADRFLVLPSRVTFCAYFDVCATNQAMELAVTRYADAVAKLGVMPSAVMITSLLNGLVKQGMVEEAVALTAHIEHVHVDTPLLNAALQTFVLSPDPCATFSAYEALTSARTCVPSSKTFQLLLMACQRLDEWAYVKDILGDMQRLGVRGDVDTLNMLLKGLLKAGLRQYAEQLYLSMATKGVAVWRELEEALPQRAQQEAGKRRHASNVVGHLQRSRDASAAHGNGLGQAQEQNSSPIMGDVDSAKSSALVASGRTRRGRVSDDVVLEQLLDNSNDDTDGDAEEHGMLLAADDDEETMIMPPAEYGLEGDDRDNGVNGVPGGPSRPHRTITPRNIDHLRVLAAKKQLRGVDPAFLQKFLVSSGVVAESEVSSLSGPRLAARVHKHLFGVWPAYRTAPIVGAQTGSGSRTASQQARRGRALQRRGRTQRRASEKDKF